MAVPLPAAQRGTYTTLSENKMSIVYPRFKAATCYIALAFLDSATTIDKAVSAVREYVFLLH